jgi:hypothetical protein
MHLRHTPITQAFRASSRLARPCNSGFVASRFNHSSSPSDAGEPSHASRTPSGNDRSRSSTTHFGYKTVHTEAKESLGRIFMFQTSSYAYTCFWTPS